jgi:hypothetical protein
LASFSHVLPRVIEPWVNERAACLCASCPGSPLRIIRPLCEPVLWWWAVVWCVACGVGWTAFVDQPRVTLGYHLAPSQLPPAPQPLHALAMRSRHLLHEADPLPTRKHTHAHTHAHRAPIGRVYACRTISFECDRRQGSCPPRCKRLSSQPCRPPPLTMIPPTPTPRCALFQNNVLVRCRPPER